MTSQSLRRDYRAQWKFYGDVPAAEVSDGLLMTSDVAVLERPLGREARVFLASFLVLFLEVA